MTPEKFVHWLAGFLSANRIITIDFLKIKEALEKVKLINKDEFIFIHSGEE